MHDSSLIHSIMDSVWLEFLKYPLSTLISSPPKHTAFSIHAIHSVLFAPREYVPGDQTCHLSLLSISPDSQYLNDELIAF